MIRRRIVLPIISNVSELLFLGEVRMKRQKIGQIPFWFG